MGLPALRQRISNKYRRVLVNAFARRLVALPRDRAYVSFTFDDFAQSAYREGGRILREHGARGSYYVALTLLGQASPSGTIASREDLIALIEDGHEVGCHTFGHLNGAEASTEEFTRSIDANQLSFGEIVPGGRLETFAYPFDGPRLAIKRAMHGRFLCCRGGGQTFNSGTVDLELVRSFFIDHRVADGLDGVADLIERNAAEHGWLVFSTHDVSDRPSKFGCSPEVFENVVRIAQKSGARILPMRMVCRELGVL